MLSIMTEFSLHLTHFQLIQIISTKVDTQGFRDAILDLTLKVYILNFKKFLIPSQFLILFVFQDTETLNRRNTISG